MASFFSGLSAVLIIAATGAAVQKDGLRFFTLGTAAAASGTIAAAAALDSRTIRRAPR